MHLFTTVALSATIVFDL